MPEHQHLLVRSTRRDPLTKVARTENNVMRRSRVLLDNGFPLSKSATRFTEVDFPAFLANKQNLIDSVKAGLLEFCTVDHRPLSVADLAGLGENSVVEPPKPEVKQPEAPVKEEVKEAEPAIPVDSSAAELPAEPVQAEPTIEPEPPQIPPVPAAAEAEDKATVDAEVPGKKKGRRSKRQQETP